MAGAVTVNLAVPVQQQPVAGEDGRMTLPWYRYFHNLQVASSGLVSIPAGTLLGNASSVTGPPTPISLGSGLILSNGVLSSAAASVSSVFGRVGAVVAAVGDYNFSQINGTATANQGGTGQTNYVVGDLLVAAGNTALSRLADVAVGNVLLSGGIGVVPAWGKVDLTSMVTGVLPVANGGTGVATANANAGFYGPASGAAAAPSFRAPVLNDSAWPSDYISGLKPIWNSVNSISVSTGEAVIPSTGLLEVVSSTLTLSGLSLAASTFYHVYLFDNAGAAAIECVTTAPDVPYRGTARAKTGDTTRRYLGSVFTDGSGNLYFFQQILTRVSYGWGGAGAAPQRPLSGGTATTATSVTLGGIPITATFANVRATNGDAAQGLRLANSLVPGAVGSTGAGTNFLYAVSANSNGYFDIPVDNSRALLYWYVAAPTGVCSIDLFGYIYER